MNTEKKEILEFLKEIDEQLKSRFKNINVEITIVGSSSAILSDIFHRKTKDIDIIGKLEGKIGKFLKRVAGKDSALNIKYDMYLDYVDRNILILPKTIKRIKMKNPKFNILNVYILDPIDFIISKFYAVTRRSVFSDRDDIEKIIERVEVDHNELIKRMQQTIDDYEMDSRIENIKLATKIFNEMEEKYWNKKTKFKLPRWLEES